MDGPKINKSMAGQATGLKVVIRASSVLTSVLKRNILYFPKLLIISSPKKGRIQLSGPVYDQPDSPPSRMVADLAQILS